MKLNLYSSVIAVCTVFFASCSKPNNYGVPENVEVIKGWSVNVMAENEIHPVTSIADSAFLYFNIYSDSSIRFDVYIDSIRAAGDVVTKLQLNAGDAVSDGPLIMDFPARVSPGGLTGILQTVRPSLLDTLMNDNIEKYVNIITTQYPTGLLRTQLNKKIIWAANVPLTGSQAVPAVTTNTTATAYLRLTADSVLYTRVNVSNPSTTDPLTVASIYEGTPGTNGSLVKTVVASASGFNNSSKLKLNDIEFARITNGNIYISAASASAPNGKIRGQIRLR